MTYIKDRSVHKLALMTNHAHILLKSGQPGLSAFMRKFLAGYSISCNRCNYRYGHLFQNRYKSIACEEEVFLERVHRKLVVKKKLTSKDLCGHDPLNRKASETTRYFF